MALNIYIGARPSEVEQSKKEARTLEKYGDCLMQKNRNFIYMVLGAQKRVKQKKKK